MAKNAYKHRKKKIRKNKNTKLTYKRKYKNRLILSSQKKNKCFEELFKSMKI